MGSFSTGIGLISGLDTASLINQILLGESRGRVRLQNEIATLQARQSSMLEVNARLLGLQSAVDTLLSASGFGAFQCRTSTCCKPKLCFGRGSGPRGTCDRLPASEALSA